MGANLSGSDTGGSSREGSGGRSGPGRRAWLRTLTDPTLWRLAWRNVGRNRRRTGIMVTAVAIGICGVFLTMSLNYGMVVQMVETAIATELGHIQIHGQGYDQKPGLQVRIPGGVETGESVGTLPGVRAWAPRVRSEGLLFSTRASAGVRLLAVDPAREAAVSVLTRSVVAGENLDGTPRRLLLGQALAERLHVGVGSKVVLSVQDLQGDMTGEGFRVGGLFRTASSEVDRGLVLMGLGEGQKLLGIGSDVSELVLLADERREVPALAQRLREELGAELEVRSWEELQPLLVYMVEMFDSTAWIVYAAVFVAMAFGIANVLLMSVHERIREIGILMAIGMQPRRLVTMILAESGLVALLGLSLGLVSALLVLFALRDGIDLSRFAEGLQAYGIGTRIVPAVRARDLWTPTVVALLTALLASLWPVLRAVRIRPADAFRRA